MAKTLNHYSQQIKALAPDALALDRAKQLGDLLLQAKAAVKAAGKLWTDWLQSDCDLTVRTAQRFMTIAKRWNEDAFTKARNANPSLAIREADKVLASTSARKRKEEAPDPYNLAMGKIAVAQWEIQLASEIKQVDQWAGAELQAAAEAIAAAKRAISKARWGEKLTDACASSFTPSARRVEMAVGDRCSCHAPSGTIDGTITAVHYGAADEWSTYSWQQDGTDQVVIVGWGMPCAASGISYSIAGPATYLVSPDSACLNQEELKRQAAERAWLKENKDEIRERHSAWVSAGSPQGEARQKWLERIGPASWE